jgi:high-affinity iron transporter
MAQILLVTLREGIEMFLIVAIASTYLRKTGRATLLPAVAWGTATAIGLSIALGVWLAETAVTPKWESLLALIAAAMIISMVIYMMRAARHMRTEIGSRLETASARPGTGAWLGVYLFVVFMITREGMETAFITASLFQQTETAHFVWGALAGLGLAALLAWTWSRYGHLVDLTLFFRVTSVFLLLFAVQLLVYAFHEATEANLLPLDNAYWHIATEPYGPEGEYGAMLTYALVLLPALWLAASTLKTRLGESLQLRARLK